MLYSLSEYTPLSSNATTWFANADAFNAYLDSIKVSVPLPQKVYRALVSQAAAAAPTAIVLENTLGVTPVFARTSAGFYTLTYVGAWTADKTFINGGGPIGAPTDLKQVTIQRTSADVLTIKTGATDTGVLADMAQFICNLEILVYP